MLCHNDSQCHNLRELAFTLVVFLAGIKVHAIINKFMNKTSVLTTARLTDISIRDQK